MIAPAYPYLKIQEALKSESPTASLRDVLRMLADRFVAAAQSAQEKAAALEAAQSEEEIVKAREELELAESNARRLGVKYYDSEISIRKFLEGNRPTKQMFPSAIYKICVEVREKAGDYLPE